MSTLVALLLVASFGVASLVTIVPVPMWSSDQVVEAAPAEQRLASPGPLGPITVIGSPSQKRSLMTTRSPRGRKVGGRRENDSGIEPRKSNVGGCHAEGRA